MSYDTRTLDFDVCGIGDVARIFGKNKNPKDAAQLEWMYQANPSGPAVGTSAVTGEDIAAIYSVAPFWMTTRNGPMRMAQSLDTLTDSGHRGRGLFKRLARSTYTAAASQGISCVYGFPNGASATGFFQNLSWIPLNPVPFLFRPLRSRYILKRSIPSLSTLPQVPIPILAAWGAPQVKVERISRFSAVHQDLWHRFAKTTGISVDRTAKYLNWRLVERPGTFYENFQIVSGAEIRGFASIRVVDKHGGRIGYLMEAIFEPTDSHLGELLVRVALRRMAALGADIALAWNFAHSGNHAAHLKAGFLPMPVALRPIELNFGVCVLSEDAETLVTDRSNWYLSYCDSDTV